MSQIFMIQLHEFINIENIWDHLLEVSRCSRTTWQTHSRAGN